MNDGILVINMGSSSVKFALFNEHNQKLNFIRSGKVSDIGHSPVFTPSNGNENPLSLPKESKHDDALRFILKIIEADQHHAISAVVHRVVHGGVDFVEPVLMTPTVLTQLHLLGTLAPLHQPQSLAAIEIINTIKPDLRQIACFDTAFHAKHHPLFNHYALPDSMRQQGIRRYGFHGLSYEWIVQELKSKHPELYRGRVIAAHLGNGASLCAIQRGASIDTTMGMTALDGLPMGTRCGSIDPGAVIYMMRELGLSAQRIEEILYNESGLLALSGISYDARQLLASRKAEAKFALDFFALKTAQFIAMMAVSVGGIDGIVFTGGIGENMSTVRDDILAYLQFLRPFDVHIIPANEERIMAQHAVTVLGNLRQV